MRSSGPWANVGRVSRGKAVGGRPLNSIVRLHVKLRAIATALAIAALSAMAKEAPREMTQFNRRCPAKVLLPELDTAYTSCRAKSRSGCSEFVRIFRELLPEYDCQRSFDATPKANYIVPAIWLAGDERLEQYVELLSKLQTTEARRLFASPEFRAVLDGHLAEEYREKSQKRAK